MATEHLTRHVLVLVVTEAVGLIQVIHGPVKGIHEFVLQELSICKVPSPPALLQAAPIACRMSRSDGPVHCQCNRASPAMGSSQPEWGPRSAWSEPSHILLAYIFLERSTEKEDASHT